MSVPPSSATQTVRETPARARAGDVAARRQAVRLAMVPALVVALTAAAAVTYLWNAREWSGTTGPSLEDPASAAVLAGALLLTCGALAGAGLAASARARATAGQYAAMRRACERSQYEIRTQLRRLEEGEPLRAPSPAPLPERSRSAGALGGLAHELALVQRTAESAVPEAVVLVRKAGDRLGPEGWEEDRGQGSRADDRVAVFVNLARRLQSLLHREIKVLDELENQVEDPDILRGVFQVDHLATRTRRYAENLAVLGGAVSRRQWTRPVPLSEILRSAAAEVEHYQRVKLVPPIEGTVRGQAVADVIHVLSELVENATLYSAPQTQVLLRATHVTAGLALEVEDRGLGMTSSAQERMNALLADPGGVDVGSLLSDGRIGLYVVGMLARRHGIVVELRGNIYGGIQAVLVLPHSVLGDPAREEGGGAATPAGATPAGAPLTGAAPTVAAAPAGVPAAVPAGVPAVPASAPAAAFGQQPPASPVWDGGPAQPPAQPQPHAQPQVPAPAPAQPQVSAPAPAQPQVPAQVPAAVRGSAPPPASAPVADGRPQLPRRRRQEHLVPELRDAPTPRAEAETRGQEPAVHDPGLMAAFRRGTSLADEGSQAPEPRPDPGPGPGPGSGLPQRRPSYDDSSPY
ncbi:ATP-binding protein [Streptomyces sp. NBC_01186]|uniref:sensor histidine kinase n=1 Tax=Streptomyces sp. NBC_01186 TaxID=2903765 RepID=UPI002E15D849|nr:ATP-binding protein [Streptomyces sp. NBC_01186]